MRKTFIATILITALASISVYALQFNPDTGVGFVSKGEVQSAFGWNNAQLQQNASGITFTYDSTQDYSAVCQFIATAGNEVTHQTITMHSAVIGNITYETRGNRQVTGFNLTGFGTSQHTGGEIPVVGNPCQGSGGILGWYTQVTATGTGSGLFVNSGGASVQLQ
jgi:hypothetical protein